MTKNQLITALLLGDWWCYEALAEFRARAFANGGWWWVLAVWMCSLHRFKQRFGLAHAAYTLMVGVVFELLQHVFTAYRG